MKKIIFSFLALSLISLCFSMSIHAQSSQQDLDQVELMKYFTGTWQAEIGKDTTVIWELIPSDKGYKHAIYYQSKGEIYATDRGMIGFTWEYESIICDILRPDGMLHSFFGKFVSKNKLIWERFDTNHTIMLASIIFEFQSQDNFIEIIKWKGWKENWDEAEVTERSYTRVK